MTNSATQTVRDHKRPRPTSRWSAVLVGLVVITGTLAVAACGSARRPATLPAGTKVTAIAAGCHHSLALTSTGRVLAWGDNANGVLGDGNTTQSDVPVEVKLPPGTEATAIAAGCFDSLAVTSTGRMLAWGDNANGQLGDGNTTQSDVPVEVKLPPGTKATAIDTGCQQSLALTSTGQSCWPGATTRRANSVTGRPPQLTYRSRSACRKVTKGCRVSVLRMRNTIPAA